MAVSACYSNDKHQIHTLYTARLARHSLTIIRCGTTKQTTKLAKLNKLKHRDQVECGQCYGKSYIKPQALTCIKNSASHNEDTANDIVQEYFASTSYNSLTHHLLFNKIHLLSLQHHKWLLVTAILSPPHIAYC